MSSRSQVACVECRPRCTVRRLGPDRRRLQRWCGEFQHGWCCGHQTQCPLPVVGVAVYDTNSKECFWSLLAWGGRDRDRDKRESTHTFVRPPLRLRSPKVGQRLRCAPRDADGRALDPLALVHQHVRAVAVTVIRHNQPHLPVRSAVPPPLLASRGGGSGRSGYHLHQLRRLRARSCAHVEHLMFVIGVGGGVEV